MSVARMMQQAAAGSAGVAPFAFLGGTGEDQTGASVSVSRPGFAKDGDVIILSIRDRFAGSGMTITGPSGFTEIVNITGGPFLSTGGYWAKKLTSADTGPFTFTTSLSRLWGLTSVTFANCDIGVDYGGSGIEGPTLPSVTPAENGNLIIMAMARNNVTITSTTPSTTSLFAQARSSYFDVGSTSASTTYGPWTIDRDTRILTGYVNLTL